jgi:hypothetical protein
MRKVPNTIYPIPDMAENVISSPKKKCPKIAPAIMLNAPNGVIMDTGASEIATKLIISQTPKHVIPANHGHLLTTGESDSIIWAYRCKLKPRALALCAIREIKTPTIAQLISKELFDRFTKVLNISEDRFKNTVYHLKNSQRL